MTSFIPILEGELDDGPGWLSGRPRIRWTEKNTYGLSLSYCQTLRVLKMRDRERKTPGEQYQERSKILDEDWELVASKLNHTLKKNFTIQECKEQWEVLQEESVRTEDVRIAVKKVRERQEREEIAKMALNKELEESKPLLKFKEDSVGDGRETTELSR